MVTGMLLLRVACGKRLGGRAQMYPCGKDILSLLLHSRLKIHLIFLQIPLTLGKMDSYLVYDEITQNHNFLL